ncbi:MAG: COX15/CtaA family protein [Planctomycetota bacterium]
MSGLETDAGAGRYSALVHRLSVILTVAVFPLIWVGGLVTTYDAGMAVPDWPGTYGENMFTYQGWLFGPFDLMVEHGHRLLGSLAGILCIFLVVSAYFADPRSWFFKWTIFVLLAVIAQGVLGGVRVRMDQRTFAMIHGCTGPLFFAVATATAVMSSRWWRSFQKSQKGGDSSLGQYATGRGIALLATSAVVASYCQLIVGAQLRHTTGMVSPGVFKGFVYLHLGLAALVFVIAICLALAVSFRRQTPLKVGRVSQLLALVVFVQIGLGIGTWVVNYALPWPEMNETLASYTISAKGYWESMTVTAHMATGSLIISLATVATLRAWRSRWIAPMDRWDATDD